MGVPVFESTFPKIKPLEIFSSATVKVRTCWHLVLILLGNGMPVAVVNDVAGPAHGVVIPFASVRIEIGHTCITEVVLVADTLLTPIKHWVTPPTASVPTISAGGITSTA